MPGLYGEPEGDLLFVLHGHTGGVTQIRFSQDGHYLFSGGRMDPEILCWDIRNPGKLVYSILRKVDTQQKIQFDLSSDGTYLITGWFTNKIIFFTAKFHIGFGFLLQLKVATYLSSQHSKFPSCC